MKKLKERRADYDFLCPAHNGLHALAGRILMIYSS
jgi:hypothetical protein